MKIGMVGLGRMGANMTRRLIRSDHEVVVYDRDPDAVARTAEDGAAPARDLDELVSQLKSPRAVWLMVPAGDATQATVTALASPLGKGDTIIDGGNSHYEHARRWSRELSGRGIDFVDAGVSGGVWGLENGYCMMVGGDRDAVRRLAPVLDALAPPDGWAHVGPSGAGHFVKMVHNGIEYGMLQSYAEGFALLDAASEFELDLHQVAALWNHGSVVRSWLLELAELALSQPDEFSRVRGYVEDSGEGRWTVNEAVLRSVAAPAITASLYARFSSREPDSFAARIIAALRNQFGGHRLLTEAPAAEDQRAAEDSSRQHG